MTAQNVPTVRDDLIVGLVGVLSHQMKAEASVHTDNAIDLADAILADYRLTPREESMEDQAPSEAQRPEPLADWEKELLAARPSENARDSAWDVAQAVGWIVALGYRSDEVGEGKAIGLLRGLRWHTGPRRVYAEVDRLDDAGRVESFICPVGDVLSIEVLS